MGWINTFLASGAVRVAAPTDAGDETVTNSAPYDARKAIQGGAEHSAILPDVQIAEDVKRRQIALAVRYVTKTRFR